MFSVNLFDPVESDIRPREKLQAGHLDVAKQSGWLPMRRELWRYLVIAGIILLGVFTFLIIKGILLAQKVRNTFASNVAVGLVAIIGFQMIVNVGMTLGVMPVTGLPLPFVSYGGSSMLSSWVIVGILLAINSRWYEY